MKLAGQIYRTRLVRAYEAALAARSLAEEATRTRDGVLAMVSHDLRSPLTAIRGQAQLLQRSVLDSDDRQVDPLRMSLGLERIEQAANRMNDLLSELVDAARLEGGHALDLQLRPTDLVGLVSAIVDEQAASTPEREMSFTSTPAHVQALVDAPRFERVLANLLWNAVKYSPNGGTIDVSLTQRDGMAEIAVTDHGIGIPVADLGRVFERFHRAGNVRGQIGGTGLGLAGARQIVQQHGGEISVSSLEGAGSTFTLSLPVREPGVSLEPSWTVRTSSSMA